MQRGHKSEHAETISKTGPSQRGGAGFALACLIDLGHDQPSTSTPFVIAYFVPRLYGGGTGALRLVVTYAGQHGETNTVIGGAFTNRHGDLGGGQDAIEREMGCAGGGSTSPSSSCPTSASFTSHGLHDINHE